MNKQLLFTMLISSIIISLFFGVFFLIEVEETANGSAVMSSKNRKQEVVALVSGNISLTRKNNDFIKKDETIGIISSNIDFNKVIEIDSFFSKIDQSIILDSFIYTKQQLEGLHNFDPAFSNFLTYNEMLNNFNLSSFTSIDILNYKNEKKRLNNQLSIYNKSMLLINAQLKEYRTFFENLTDIKTDKIISNLEYLKYKKEFENLMKEKNNISLKINQLNNIKSKNLDEIDLLESSYIDKKRDLSSKYISSFIALKNNYLNWKNQHIIYARMDGEIQILDNLKKLDFISAGTPILNIYPINEEIIIEGNIDVKYLPKLSLGQEVLITIPGYSYFEYGKVKAELMEFSSLNNNIENNEGKQVNSISVKIKIPNKIITTNDKELTYFPENPVSIEVILDRKKYGVYLFENIIQKLKS